MTNDASMGPGSFDPGNAVEGESFGGAGNAASMGPGSFDPGNDGTCEDLADAYNASMGPGSFDPGNPIPAPMRRAGGSGFNGAGVF